jgi:hypothetical protein
MRSRIVALILLAAMPAVSVLSAAPAAAQAWMVGTWFGHGQPQDTAAMYIDRMRPGGSWRGEYRTCMKGKAVDTIQTGHWSVEGDTLILKVETVDGSALPRTDTYKMLAHSPTAQKYLSTAWNFPYTPQRVADDFQMPSCELVS